MTPYLFGVWAFAFLASLLATMSIVNMYTVLWALGKWGVIQSEWQE